MKIVFALATLALAVEENGPIAYLCNQCDLYDIETDTIFDTLETPGWMGEPLNKTMNINIKLDHDKMLKANMYYDTDIVERFILIFTVMAVIVGLLNLVITVTLLLTERKVNASARKTYMKTAMLET